jgi:ornithine carrier protein
MAAYATSHPPALNFYSNAHHTLLNHPPNAQFTLSSTMRPPGAFAIIRSTIQTYGFRGLWLGHTGTLLRETGGTAAWFSVKELVAVTLRNRRVNASQSSDFMSDSQPTAEATDLLPWESALAGAISGGACVLAFYPADTVKSAMQTEDELRSPRPASAKPLSRSFAGTLMRMYGAHGLRGLYAGCGMTVARAVPSSGIVFVVYDGLSSWLG